MFKKSTLRAVSKECLPHGAMLVRVAILLRLVEYLYRGHL
jgi:hypothetical protein